MYKLHISEMFLSVQGEGPSIGFPSIFLRLKGCVLNCAWCDTAAVWKTGRAWDFAEICEAFYENDWFSKLDSGFTRLVVTGGDPLLQQNALVAFFNFCAKETKSDPACWTIEVENQGSLMPDAQLLPYVSQWNISPKLANSGEPYLKRIVPAVLRFYASMELNEVSFKFPISLPRELEEVREICCVCNIPKDSVILMPLAATREDFEYKGRIVAAMCIKHGYRFGSRLHLTLWDKAVGV
jgi:organic radical activating enzyme